MPKKVVHTSAAPNPVGPYSQAMLAGPFLFCSGQIAIDPRTDQVISGSVADHTRQVLDNVEAVLKAAGASLSQVVKSTIFLTDMNDFAAVNEVYAQRFSAEPPARSTVAVKGLPKGVPVEIEVVAYLG